MLFNLFLRLYSSDRITSAELSLYSLPCYSLFSNLLLSSFSKISLSGILFSVLEFVWFFFIVVAPLSIPICLYLRSIFSFTSLVMLIMDALPCLLGACVVGAA